ncbi:MAG: hybrid sensor histidine kinase/response regulator [Deltaproteobacteria bacterium]|nr:hybrid sensor histidine kinase/response regulator [Deltaproteobacteria bacterium]
MPMIEDEELRGLFKAESEEHIQKIEAGLMRLEKGPLDKDIVEEVFREAHSLKGAARMVGVRDIEIIGHRIEDMLGAVRRGEAALAPEAADCIYKALDAVKRLVSEAATGEPSGVSVASIIGLLSREKDKKKETEKDAAPKAPAHSGHGAEESAHPLNQAGGRADSAPFRIETVRVETKKLDNLMTHSGELIVLKTRFGHLIAGIDEIAAIWDEALPLFQRLSGGPSSAGAKALLEGIGQRLGSFSAGAYAAQSRLESIAGALDEAIRGVRLVPFSALFGIFPRMVRDMARERAKEAVLVIEGADTMADKRIIEEMKDPVMHMLRNAVDHGIEPPDERESAGKPREGVITLRAARAGSDILIEVSDDGRGLDAGAVKKAAVKRRLLTEEAAEGFPSADLSRIVFMQGFSTSSFVTDTSGRGVGLDVVKTNVENLKGSVQAESATGRGFSVRVRLPASLSTLRALIVAWGANRYAIPSASVHTLRLVHKKDIFHVEGRDTVVIEGKAVPISHISEALGLASPIAKAAPSTDAALQCVVVSSDSVMFAVIVDGIEGEEEVVLKPQSPLLKRVRNVAGSAILGSGDICVVLKPEDMAPSTGKREMAAVRAMEEEKGKEAPRKVILLAEDSITTRTQEKRILEGAGYEVVIAVDGLDALNKLPTRSFDAVVSDILMPNMDGLTLTARIRQDKRFRELPVILVTTLASDEDKKKGLEAGASAYIPKPSFEQKMFLDTLKRLA